MGARKRLDALLVERGLFESRSKASAAVVAGEARLGPGRERAAKPGMLVPPEAEVEVDSPPRYVSRGGLKLERALACFDVSPTGRLCLDVGASTGGVTGRPLPGGAAPARGLGGAPRGLPPGPRPEPPRDPGAAAGPRRGAGRRLRRAPLEPAAGSPRDRDRARERALARPGRASLCSGCDHPRRLVHRARKGAARRRANGRIAVRPGRAREAAVRAG